MRWTIIGAAAAAIAVAAGVGVRLADAPPEPREYPQATPEATLDAIFEMVESQDAGRLPELIHADTAGMRAALEELSLLTGELQQAAQAAAEAFPRETAALRAAMRDDPAAALSTFRPRGGTVDPTAGPGRESLRMILADPYGWLVIQRDRLSTAMIDDQRAAILRDGRPVFGVGMIMRRGEDERWRIELPLRFPGSSRFVPQSDDEWKIVGSLLRVFASAVDELEGDIRAGRARDMSDAARLAGEKALGPIVLVGIAYRQALEARGRGN